MTEHDCEKHDTRKRFNHVLKTFLAKKVEAADNGSSWAPVTPETRGQLEELIHLLILLKWEEDCDGDLPMRFKLLDRTSEMGDSFHQFTINRDPDKNGGLVRWLGRLTANVSMATEALRREVDCLEFRKITVEMPDEDE